VGQIAKKQSEVVRFLLIQQRNTNSFNIINIKTILLRKDRDYETLNSSERYDTLNKIYCCTLYLCLTFHKKIPVFLALTVQGKIGKTQKKEKKRK